MGKMCTSAQTTPERQHRWLNVISQLEVMIEVPIEGDPTEEELVAAIRLSLLDGNWRHVSRPQVVNDITEGQEVK